MRLSKEFIGLGMIIASLIFSSTLPDIYKGIVILIVVGCLWFFELLPFKTVQLFIDKCSHLCVFISEMFIYCFIYILNRRILPPMRVILET